MRPSWDDWGLGIALAVSARADCSRAQHGAIIMRPDRTIAATGYNGAPAGHLGCLTDGACPRASLSYADLPTGSSYDTGPGRCIALHAEQNCIIHCAWPDLQGSTMYVTGKCCDGCMKMVLGSGLSRVVWPAGDWIR